MGKLGCWWHMTKSLSQPPESCRSSPFCQHCREKWNIFDFLIDFPASLLNDPPFEKWHQCPGPNGRATLQIKLGKTSKRKKKLKYLWSTIPQKLKYFQHEKLYTCWKNHLTKYLPGSWWTNQSVDVSVYWTKHWTIYNLLQD